MTDPRRNDTRPDPTSPRAGLFADLSLAQIGGGALAAATAAALGSRLGVAGTVLGAAVASLIAAVGSKLYTAGLHQGARGLVSARDYALRRGRPTPAEDGLVHVVGVSDTGERVDGPDAADDDAAPVAPPRHRRPRRGLAPVLASVLVTAVASLTVAFALITATEAATGRALDGSEGTTITQVTNRDGDPVPAPADSASPTGEPTRPTTRTPTAPAETPTNSPSPQASEQAPTPSATPSQQPSRQPTAQNTPAGQPTS